MEANADLGEMERLRHAAEFVQLRRTLKPVGRATVAWGALNLVLGLAGVAETPIAWAVVSFGIGLVVVGIWNLRSLTPRSMLADSIGMFVLSAWNMLVGLGALAVGAAADAVPALVFGVAQFAWAVSGERRYRRYAALAREHPSAESLQRLDALVESLNSKAAAERPDVIDFVAGVAMRSHAWRAQLSRPWALFLDRSGGEVVVATPGEVELVDRGELLIGSKHTAAVKLRDRKIVAVLTPAALERFAAWKAAPAA